MKKNLLVCFLCIMPFILFAQQPVYSRVKIYADAKPPGLLLATGIEINYADREKNTYIAEISQQEISLLSAAGFRYDVIIPDMEKYYTDRFYVKTAVTEKDNLLSETWPEPVNFSLGTCGGFSTLSEMTDQLDLMRSLYPSLITVKKTLNDTVRTIEGRKVYYVKISDNPDVKESEPEILYTGMHHAREPIAMQHLLYYMWYLLENYDRDSSIKALVDTTEMYFVPVVNVDGYAYNIANKPSGGGMWRKNRRNNGDGSYGADVNRNYDFKWGYDNLGSSSVTSSEIYRGNAPFSEPETRMMKYFCEKHNFLIALNYHSYSNLLLYPWGWSDTTSADNLQFQAYAKLMTKENNYTYGPGSTTIYLTNGGSDDWMYGEQTTKPAILSYTPEVGNSTDGFWPSQQRILPLIQENMFASITAARLAGKYGIITDASPLFIYEKSGYLPFEVKRLGIQDGSFNVSVTALGNTFTSVGDKKNLQNIKLLETYPDSIPYHLSNSIQVGDTIQYVLAIDNGYFSEYDTVTRIFGYPLAVFYDDLTAKNNWTGNWNITSSQYFSPPSSMTDSPSGNYASMEDKSITLINPVVLPLSSLMVLQFRAKWELEKDYDCVQVSVSDNNGTTWNPLAGKYTLPGTVNQFPGQPVYDGKKGDWVSEAISLNDYMGKSVEFRFRLKSDQAVELDGFYFDDFKISMLLDPTASGEKNPKIALLGNPYPNPANNRFEVGYSLPNLSVKADLVITTPSGVVVYRTRLNELSGNAKIDIPKLASGIYFVKLVSEGLQSPVRKLVVR